ncbi:MAG: hypothetical protein F9K16_06185 [Thermoanaerobaculia bacterium]|jgi:hypothetical protein|nr:MAG: hypothetical protein F9K16_06185 [Thermoanaerobaculia bacterium]MBZ0102295.1 hypothetical protein [Thermoanaerobaculia bacterium]
MNPFGRIALCLSTTLLAGAAVLPAGVYTDDLAKCLVESTTEADRVGLVRWMFVAASAHPAVRPISNVTETDLDAANKGMAELVLRLLTESCRDAARKAVQYEGASTFEASFEVLGSVAGQELFGSPEVAGALAGLEKHLDGQRLTEALGVADTGSSPGKD